MPILLALTAETADENTLPQLTRELARALAKATDVSAEVLASPAPPEAKGGEWLTQATPIALELVSKGGPLVAIAAAVASVLKVYVQRAPKLKFSWQPKSGKKLEITAEDLDDDKLDRVIALIEKSFKEDDE